MQDADAKESGQLTSNSESTTTVMSEEHITVAAEAKAVMFQGAAATKRSESSDYENQARRERCYHQGCEMQGWTRAGVCCEPVCNHEHPHAT